MSGVLLFLKSLNHAINLRALIGCVPSYPSPLAQLNCQAALLTALPVRAQFA
jgi:hypothetical protein